MKTQRTIAALLLPVLIFALSALPAQADDALPTSKVVAQGAILMDFETGRVLWEKNAHEPLPMASTTKIMTAILTLEKGDLNDIVTISANAAHTPEVNMNLTTGEKIKLENLLYALMLQSSNDSAVAIAEYIGGSVEEFCRMMTAKAKEIGAKDTVFETPNGLDKGDHHSTAYDMALIARYAMKNPEFIKIINTQGVSAESDKKSYVITNKNRLLYEYEGANGIKTGFTGKAGHCFVGAAKRGDMQLISVVLASGWGDKGKAQKWVDTKAMLNYGFQNYQYYTVFNRGDEAGSVTVNRSKTPSVRYYYAEGLRLPLTKTEKENLRVAEDVPSQMLAPVQKGQKLGDATVLVCNTAFAQIPLIAEDSAARHDLKSSIEKLLNVWFEMGTDGDVSITLPENILP